MFVQHYQSCHVIIRSSNKERATRSQGVIMKYVVYRIECEKVSMYAYTKTENLDKLNNDKNISIMFYAKTKKEASDHVNNLGWLVAN